VQAGPYKDPRHAPAAPAHTADLGVVVGILSLVYGLNTHHKSKIGGERGYVGSRRMMICFDVGVLEPSAVESSGTSTFASGKYAAAQPGAVG
jgi:hypothetical protein